MKRETWNCLRVNEFVESFVDGDLAEAEREPVARHVASCRTCAARVDLAERLRAELRALPRLDAPPGTIARIKAQARTEGHARVEPRERFRRSPWQRPLWAALAAAVLLVALALALLTPGRQEPSDQEVARAAAEARYALARVAQLTSKATREAGRELGPRLLAQPALDGLARSLGRVRDAAQPARAEEGGAES